VFEALKPRADPAVMVATAAWGVYNDMLREKAPAPEG